MSSAPTPTSTPGDSACMTAGMIVPNTELMVIGRLGGPQDRGSLEHFLIQRLTDSGMPEEFTQDTAQQITLYVAAWFKDRAESSTSDILTKATEPENPPDTLT